jgi:hypothetical protein
MKRLVAVLVMLSAACVDFNGAYQKRVNELDAGGSGGGTSGAGGGSAAGGGATGGGAGDAGCQQPFCVVAELTIAPKVAGTEVACLAGVFDGSDFSAIDAFCSESTPQYWVQFDGMTLNDTEISVGSATLAASGRHDDIWLENSTSVYQGAQGSLQYLTNDCGDGQFLNPESIWSSVA